MKIKDELCHDKRRLCRDRVWQGYNTSQLRQVLLCCDKVFSIGPAQGRIYVVTMKTLSRHKMKRTEISQDKFVATKISMFQQTVQPATRIIKEILSRQILSRQKETLS